MGDTLTQLFAQMPDKRLRLASTRERVPRNPATKVCASDDIDRAVELTALVALNGIASFPRLGGVSSDQSSGWLLATQIACT